MPTDSRPRLLILDDETAVRQTFEAYFRQVGYAVTACGDVRAGLQCLADGIDVVLSDIRMPGADGVDFLRAARQLQPDVGIFLITGYPTVESIIDAKRAGAQAYFRKPVSLAEVDQRLRAFLAGGTRG
jgi:DNA-binding NtrC family response regulator